VPTDLWEGARRLPYFYVYGPGGWIMCAQCALEHRGDEQLVAQYTTLRSLMCCRCGILLGPINKAETEGNDE
jgi:hypothetical protein